MSPPTTPSRPLYTPSDLEVQAALMRLEVPLHVRTALQAFRNDVYRRSAPSDVLPSQSEAQPEVDVLTSARNLLARALVAAAPLTPRRGSRVSCAWDEAVDGPRDRTWFYLVRDLDRGRWTCLWVANPMRDWFWWLAFRRDRLVKLERRIPEGMVDT
jgi:hypothetical protein